MEGLRHTEQLTIEDLADATAMILAMALHGGSEAIRPGLYYALDAVVLSTRIARSLPPEESEYLCKLLPVSGIERDLLGLIDDLRLSAQPNGAPVRAGDESTISSLGQRKRWRSLLSAAPRTRATRCRGVSDKG